MLRISLPWIVESLKSLDGLSELKAGLSVDEAPAYLISAQLALEDIFENSVYKGNLRVSIIKGRELYHVIDNAFNRLTENEENKLTELEVAKINHLFEQMKVIFLSELATLPIYLVVTKGSYDVESLIDAGIRLFPENLTSKVPEAEKDAMEVGRCLAFEVPTSCGFHTFRVVESVLRRYWDNVSNGKDRPFPATLGNLAGQLEINKFGSDVVWEALKQLAKLHRNPLAHPDVILTQEEADAAIGMARSVITHMLKILPDIPPTTGAIGVSEDQA